VAANAVADVVTVQQATLGAPVEGAMPVPGLAYQAAFDGILANIVTRVIAERAAPLAAALRPQGWLVASGIIADREAEASTALEAHGLSIERRRQRGDWVALECRRMRQA
jgi:ribosomal protein L11 methyltransferase